MKIKKCTGCDTTNENPLQYGVQACCPDSNYVEMTAVEWYEKEINFLIEKYEAKEISKREFITMQHNLFYNAKEMEKQQIIDFHVSVMKKGLIEEDDRKWSEGYLPKITEVAEQCYNETFKK
jgi:hypothetical protein